MRRRLSIVAGLAAAVAVIPVAPAAAERSCGTVHGTQGALHGVTIRQGRLTCTQVRAIAKEYASGQAKFHGPPNGPRADQYDTLPGGWRCSVIEQGTVGCVRRRSHKPAESIGWIVD
jgi:hypothetical protein